MANKGRTIRKGLLSAGCLLNKGSNSVGLLYFSSDLPCIGHSVAVVTLDFDSKDLRCELQRSAE